VALRPGKAELRRAPATDPPLSKPGRAAVKRRPSGADRTLGRV
jgi:hypothetical protein